MRLPGRRGRWGRRGAGGARFARWPGGARGRLLAGTVVLAVALALLVSGTASAGGLPAPVREALARHRLPAESLSVWVQDAAAPDAAPLVSHRPDVPRNPASTIKLVTTLAALDELGPDYEWETRAYVTGPVREGRLDGDLVLVGSGDPLLVIEQLWRLLEAVRARGLETVAGRLVIDNTRFSVAGEPAPGEFDGKPYRAYNAPPDAFLVNFNVFDVVVDSRGGKVRAWTEPPVAGLRLRVRAGLRSGGCARRDFRLDVSGPLAARSPLDAPLPGLTVAGRFPRGCAPGAFPRSVLPPPRFADGVVRALWTRMGGRIEGGLAVAPVPEGAALWRRHRSPPLAIAVRGINKFSNNVMSRNLLLTLGAERFGPPGTTDKGRRAVAAWLGRKGIEAPHLRVVNGSGLSRETRASARGLGKILLAGERSRFRPELAASLPIASVDGTMRSRLRRHPEAARARIKTGLLKGVRAMAGYVRTRSGRTLAVAALQEHPGVHLRGRGTAVQDALLAWLLERD